MIMYLWVRTLTAMYLDRREFGKVVTSGTLAGLTGCVSERRVRPNILLIMADDMGFSDLGCYGGEIQTPNLDRLARGGVRYTRFYNTSRCCPTRASLLTGQYAHQTGMGWMTAADLGQPGYTGDLGNRCVTIAEVLRESGYRTYMSGKWHLCHDRYLEPEGPKHNWPCQRGFDHYFGILRGGSSYFNPRSLTRDNTQIEPWEDFYLTDAFSDAAVDFIDGHFEKGSDQPFFLYLSYTAPHFPIHAKPGDIAKYRGKYQQGWERLRSERHERMKAEGLVDSSWGLSDRDVDIPSWDDLSSEKKREMDLRMAIYAAQIDCMDQGIGRVIETLRRQKALENTVILFLSDNGGTHEMVSRREINLEELGTDKYWETYQKPWANTSNTPFRLYKHWVHEGGISTPLIAHWPAAIAARNRLRSQVGHVIDLMPTCLELADASYPSELNNRPILPLEGTSLMSSFAGTSSDRAQLFWEHESNRAIRQGHWKLVASGKEGPWELYDLEADRTELYDLAKKDPKLVRELAASWQGWAERCQVLPLDDRKWGERLRSVAR